MLKEFREFAMKGNVMDLAVAVIIGGAFGKIVDSIVKDVLMPILGIPGKLDFANAFVVLNPGKSGATAYASLDAAVKDGANVLAYGNFINTVIAFVTIAMCVFLIVKALNKMKREKPVEAEAPAGPSSTDALLMEIRDLLKK
ncbi:MAG: large conductance mechanosensitive channel protein MscL [Armatimonadetes bacterium]|nr:large conductance mechanosensitive channel protein MscL [Armatimonadota bacterium]